MSDTTPAMSVVVVTPSDFAQIRRTVRHLRQQTVVDRIELVLVATSEEAVADARGEELEGFAAVRVEPAGPIDNVDRSSSVGILAASADIIGIVEDHGYPHEGWAEAIIDAYASGPWSVVGSIMENPNPGGLSWSNLLLGYGWWMEPGRAGEVDECAGHNVTYRRSAIEPYFDGLIDHLGRTGDLHDRLRADGHRFGLAEHARIEHANPSRLPPTAELRFSAGRLYGARRAREERWSPVRRLAYIALVPLIPLVRLRRIWGDHFATGRAHRHLVPGVLPALLLSLAFDAVGQAAGYARGPGRAPAVLATFEMDRMQHLTARDRRRLREQPPPVPAEGRAG